VAQEKVEVGGLSPIGQKTVSSRGKSWISRFLVEKTKKLEKIMYILTGESTNYTPPLRAAASGSPPKSISKNTGTEKDTDQRSLAEAPRINFNKKLKCNLANKY